MKRIIIGSAKGKKAGFDIPELLVSRLLIQANSGGGKSYLLRRIFEQAFGRVQQFVIDPAGEFASLREKYGYVLVGEGGETPADVRSAGLVAEKLLELRASAVFDLYSLKPDQRHVWVKNFLAAMMNAPKKLWHPVIVAVDEAHKFMPESGEGESDAKSEMLSLCSDGRKYGYCAILATQRLAKLDKSGASELTNVMIGPTFIKLWALCDRTGRYSTSR
jgi:DNA helicase HerA-like ATPase